MVINMGPICMYYITPTNIAFYYLMMKVTDNMTEINILCHGVYKIPGNMNIYFLFFKFAYN